VYLSAPFKRVRESLLSWNRFEKPVKKDVKLIIGFGNIVENCHSQLGEVHQLYSTTMFYIDDLREKIPLAPRRVARYNTNHHLSRIHSPFHYVFLNLNEWLLVGWVITSKFGPHLQPWVSFSSKWAETNTSSVTSFNQLEGKWGSGNIFEWVLKTSTTCCHYYSPTSQRTTLLCKMY